MMRSMYSAVSSLKAHQLKMDVIGNNIANVNTVGFKGTRVTFQEVFSQTLRGAGRAQEGGRGGTNPQQVGLGINVNSMDTFHTRGSVESTGYNTDLMINGEGFFVVSDTQGGLQKSYTRAGAFGLDANGNLITPDGYYVLGYTAVRDADGQVQKNEKGQPIFEENLTGLRISRDETAPPAATTKATFTGNIDSNLSADSTGTAGDGGIHETVMKVHDSLGNAHTVKVQFQRTDQGNDTKRTFAVTITELDNVKLGAPIPLEPATPLTFDSAGILDKTALTKGTLKLGHATDGLDGAKQLSIELDFTKLTSYAADKGAKSDAAALEINGYASGKIDDFTISTTGEIEANFTNGSRQILGRVGLANFKNPAGLLKTGGNMYRETSNSGEVMFGYAGTGGFGALNPGAIEMSNVDISREFTDMITTQRGFQANSRIITTSDEMLQEIVNMKR
ncbi:flagellar hook protein FlgE [Alkaliphilus oremlandii]|uniref:Flagellar hook protein FlgE n=1 Tax=Alkaliphilus oremlandii (strain OhILAs) TaxID=350688 RepID=A8MHE5_ALKOO|nr:flagellar hook protein FlgE [Alkaliphilus oremlandii]ABW19032.1 protein of unknown function DUF1078 domain protein [Alkaliphilus oremlandii OhILAs]